VGRKTQDFFPNRMTARTAARHGAPDDTHRSKQTPPPLTALAPAPAATSRERLLSDGQEAADPWFVSRKKNIIVRGGTNISPPSRSAASELNRSTARAPIQHFFLKRFVIVKNPHATSRRASCNRYSHPSSRTTGRGQFHVA
jgi:hypothetical protein